MYGGNTGIFFGTQDGAVVGLHPSGCFEFQPKIFRRRSCRPPGALGGGRGLKGTGTSSDGLRSTDEAPKTDLPLEDSLLRGSPGWRTPPGSADGRQTAFKGGGRKFFPQGPIFQPAAASEAWQRPRTIRGPLSRFPLPYAHPGPNGNIAALASGSTIMRKGVRFRL